jgi:predicted SAM-dependent methyltransferase
MATKKEIDLLKAYCQGRGLNIGCGKRRIESAINVDIDLKSFADIYADASLLPFFSERFDYLVSSHCLEHVREAPLIVLREWLRVLKIGGVMAFIVPDSNDGVVSMGSTPGKFIPFRHVHAFDIKTLKALIEYAGAKLEKIEVVKRKEWRTNTIFVVATKIKKSNKELDPNCLMSKYSWAKQALLTKRFRL